MPAPQPPRDISIDPVHADSFAVNVRFYANSVDVNEAISSLRRAVEELRTQITALQERVDRLT